MKRSYINRKLKAAVAFLKRNKFHLPQWAYWSPQKWARAGHEADEIRQRGLGWDVTDFGSGDFERCGLLAFTIRNGQLARKPSAFVKDYCEKLLLVDEGQVVPCHFHWSKMEDIINRGGGRLVLRLWNADRRSEAVDKRSRVVVSIDGIETSIKAGGLVVLDPGQSITLPPYNYHLFYGQKGKGMVLCGEVSRVNDDKNDNRFNPPLPRFSTIEEDAAPLYLLCNEYPPA